MYSTILLSLTTIIPPIIYFFYILIRNYFSNQYFQKNLPQLPILDDQKPLIGHIHLTMGQRSWRHIEDGHKKLGKYYGLYNGHKRIISTIDLDFIKRFAIDEDRHDRFSNWDVGINELELDCLPLTQGEQWRNIRRAIVPAFSKHKVMSANVQAEINSVIDKFIESLEWRLNIANQERGLDFIVEDVDVHSQKYALALVFACFYKQYDLVDFHAETDEWQSTIEVASKSFPSMLSTIPQVFSILNNLARVLIFFHPYGKFMVKLRGFLEQQTELYKRAKSEIDGNVDFSEANFTLKDGTIFRGNMIDHFIGKFLEKKVTEREFYHSSMFLFEAGVKTSSDALSRLIYQLACHQDVQDKLRESILLSGSESDYLNWVMNESLRLFPPVHLACSRTLTQDMETKFGTIPKDTLLFTHSWTIHRWPEYWGSDVNEFKPERWSKSDTFHPLQFIPFGAGRKVCPGKEFALTELRMVVAKLLQRYKFERSEKTTDSLRFTAPFAVVTSFDDPTWIKISRLKTDHGIGK